MVCPNCQSTDIITVQGENFCIACGHVVPKTSAAKPAPTLEELSKVQAKVAGSHEMAVLVGSKKTKSEPEPLAPKVRGLGPKLKAEVQEVAAPVTVQVTPGANQAAAAAAQAELSQAVAKAMAPAATAEPEPAETSTNGASEADTEPASTDEASSLIVKHKTETLKPAPSDESAPADQDNAASAKPSILKAAISRFAAPDGSAETATAAAATSQDNSDMVAAPAEVSTPKTVAKSVPSPKKRKPGRPKAGRLDVPKPAAVAPIQPVASVLSVTEPAPAAAPKLRPGSPRAVTDIRPASSNSAPITAQVAPIARTTANKPKTSAAEPAATPNATQSPDSLTAPADTPGFSQPLAVDAPMAGLSGVMRLSLHERIRPISFAWSLIPATFLALIIGGTVLAVTNGRLEAVITATQRAGWAVWGEGLLILGLYYLSHSLINAVIVFGIARRTAHRPVPLARQFGAAINTWLPRLGLDIAATVLALAVSSFIIGLVIAGSTPWPLPEWVHVTGLFVGFLALIYVVVGLMLAQGLGRIGLTVSTLSPGGALKLGWQLFWNHFELAGFRALALLLELLLLVPFAAGIVALNYYLPASFNWTVVLGAILLSVIAGALAGAGTAAWWEGAYRHLVEQNYPNESGRLLGGRPAERPRPLALTTLITALTILIGLSIAWPWLPLH